jgi:phage terminase large subunit
MDRSARIACKISVMSATQLPSSVSALPVELKAMMLARLRKMPAGAHVSQANIARLRQYQDDPVSFIQNELGSTLTAEQREVCDSVRDYETTIVKSANAVGKTYDAAHIAVWFYKCFPDSQVYTAAAPPESNLKRLLWGEIGRIVGEQPKLFADDTVNVLHIARNEWSFITGVTIPASGTEQQREAKFSGKHAPNLLFIIDEGDAVPDEVYRGIDACMSGGRARLLVMFNPRNESGPVYRKERDHQGNVISLSAFHHPNVITGQEQIRGAVTREKTVKRINEWSRPLQKDEKADSESFEVPAYLVGVTAKGSNGNSYLPLAAGVRRITDPALSYMVLGQYPAQSETQLISRAWISAARARWDVYLTQFGERAPANAQAIHGQDVAEFGADENVACFRYGGWVAPFITWSGIDTLQTGERAADLARVHKPLWSNVDATGVGAGVAPVMMRKGCRAHRIMVASSPTIRTEQGEFNILRDQIWWAMREWLRTDPGAMLPPDERLCEELATPTYSVDRGKIRVMTKDVIKELLRHSPDRADSLALTFAPIPARPGKKEAIF